MIPYIKGKKKTIYYLGNTYVIKRKGTFLSENNKQNSELNFPFLERKKWKYFMFEDIQNYSLFYLLMILLIPFAI